MAELLLLEYSEIHVFNIEDIAGFVYQKTEKKKAEGGVYLKNTLSRKQRLTF